MTVTHDFPPTWVRRIAGILRSTPDVNEYARVLYRMQDFRWRWYQLRHGPYVDPDEIMMDVEMFRVAIEAEFVRQERDGTPVPEWKGPIEQDDADWPELVSSGIH